MEAELEDTQNNEVVQYRCVVVNWRCVLFRWCSSVQMCVCEADWRCVVLFRWCSSVQMCVCEADWRCVLLFRWCSSVQMCVVVNWRCVLLFRWCTAALSAGRLHGNSITSSCVSARLTRIQIIRSTSCRTPGGKRAHAIWIRSRFRFVISRPITTYCYAMHCSRNNCNKQNNFHFKTILCHWIYNRNLTA